VDELSVCSRKNGSITVPDRGAVVGTKLDSPKRARAGRHQAANTDV